MHQLKDTIEFLFNIQHKQGVDCTQSRSYTHTTYLHFQYIHLNYQIAWALSKVSKIQSELQLRMA